MNQSNEEVRCEKPSLMDRVQPLQLLFAWNGYEVQRPIYIWSAVESSRAVHFTIHSDLGAGGMQDACIELTDDDVCKVYVGRPYSTIPPRGAGPRAETTSWSRAEFPANLPDLGQVLLRKVRQMLLEE